MTAETGDPFEDVHHLEETFYKEGYEQGIADGSKAGRLEGRAFGLEKGFEKFVELGKLAGRAQVWSNRTKRSGDDGNSGAQIISKVPSLPSNLRLQKHLVMLSALSDPATFSTMNNEEAVADFDDRFKRATAKAKVIERMVGESGMDETVSTDAQTSLNTAVSSQSRLEKSMEDFGAR
jgi:hypothetical protein